MEEEQKKFAIVPADNLEMLLHEIRELREEVRTLHLEKELPEEMTVKEAQAFLRLSRQRIYTLIYSQLLKAVQHTRNGKLLIPRDEVIRFKKQNVKASD